MLYLFDIDGTLVLTGGAGSVALDRVFRERYQLDGAMANIRAGGMTDGLIVAEIFHTRLGRAPTAGEIEAILTAYVPYLEDAVRASEAYEVMPAVFEALAYLDRQPGVHLALATGNIRACARIKLERADLWRRFPDGGFGDDSHQREVLVTRAIERAQARIAATGDSEMARERIVVVGDTPRDVDAARACGVRVIAVATGFWDRASLEATGADAVFDTLAELPAWHETYAGGQSSPVRDPT